MRIRRLTAIALAALLLPACQNRLPDACYEKPDSGRCRASFERYWFDTDTQSCRAFIWGGCGGHVPFATADDCRKACMGGAPADIAPVAPAKKPAPVDAEAAPQ